MRHFVSGVCCLIVALQILIGVPLVVCAVFFFVVAEESVGPIAVEVHAGQAGPPAVIPPPNYIPQAASSLAAENPILETRAQCGSPLAGTVLETDSPGEEEGLFVAAIERVAAEEEGLGQTQNETARPAVVSTAHPMDPVDLLERANQFAIQQLYAIADSDERAGEFGRADQWRALAREIRRAAAGNPSPGEQSANDISLRPGLIELPD